MSHINSPMEIFKLLNGSNCRECHEKTCLAFAVAVFKEKKPIHACPYLDKEVLEKYGGTVEKPDTIDEYKARAIEELKQQISSTDIIQQEFSRSLIQLCLNFYNTKQSFQAVLEN